MQSNEANIARFQALTTPIRVEYLDEEGRTGTTMPAVEARLTRAAGAGLLSIRVGLERAGEILRERA